MPLLLAQILRGSRAAGAAGAAPPDPLAAGVTVGQGKGACLCGVLFAGTLAEKAERGGVAPAAFLSGP